MSDTTPNIKKSRKGRPRADTEPVMVRLHADLLAAIDNFRREQDDLPTRPEGVRRILTDWLKAQGYLK